MSDALLSVKQVAKALGYSEKTIRKKFERGQLPGFQLGGKNCQIKMPASVVEKVKELK